METAATRGMTHAPAEPSPVPLRGFPLYRLLFWASGRMLLARLRGVSRQSPLLLLVLGLFILTYLGIGYWLFFEGLQYLHRFPLIGGLLSQRILFLIFFFFFLMLVFSNVVIGYSTLFKNRETAWFLTLPIRHRDTYRWKFLETLTVASWALVFLSAPLMAAFGRVHQVDGWFYLKAAAAYVPFVILPALCGSWIILTIVRVLARPWSRTAMFLLGGGLLGVLYFSINPVTAIEAANSSEAVAFDQLLKHSRLSLNPNLPSAWLAHSLIAWSEDLPRQGAFYFFVLLSNALMGLLIGFYFFQRLFYGSWSATLGARAERYQRRADATRRRRQRDGLTAWLVDHLPFVSRPVRALVLKDARLFWRDPAQWTQFLIFFGLLCIYVLNLRNVAFNFQSEFWETMISYLNLAASSLTLSTLTTRFVFPQFSLEGRRLWILGLAPVGLRRIILQKFWMASLSTMFITVLLMVVSSAMLHLAPSRVLFFTTSIALMSATLSGLAVGLGALFPNFKEDNPSKVVSGFGGTLCLVVSFIYIVLFVALAAMSPVLRVLDAPLQIPLALGWGAAGLLSLLVLGFPLGLALQRLKNLEF